MREKIVEGYLRKRVRAVGGLIEKHKSERRGPPDDLITWPDGTMDLVETKRPKGGRLSPSQVQDHKRRAKRHYIVAVIWTIEQVDEYMASKCDHF